MIKSLAPAVFGVFLAMTLSLLATMSATADPSFDCGKARTLDEKEICSDRYLAQIDSAVSDAYRSYEPEFQSKSTIVSRTLEDRSDCGDDDACIAAVQLSALQTYKGMEPWVYSYAVSLVGNRASLIGAQKLEGSIQPPRKHAECSQTRIRSLTTRFGEPVSYGNEDLGTAVEYENGVFVISYSRDDGLYNAKVGQPVVVCLLTVPYDCPAGDDRGRFYYTLNLSTRLEWVMADAQHVCGGA